MPTGYTQEVMEKDVSFRDFALRCARAFGALIELRDESLDTPIPKKFKPSPYYAAALKEAKTKYKTLKAMSPKGREQYGETQKVKALAHSTRYLEKAKAENVRLDKMLAEVEKWQPPTPDHSEMKRFMREQLTISRNDLSWSLKSRETAQKKPALAYYEEALETALNNIAYYKEQLDKEKERVDGRNEWLDQLRNSL